MALKHVKKYFTQVATQYMKMGKMLEGFEKELAEGTVEESQLLTAREIIKPLKENYDRLAYIIYLFDLPNDSKSRKNREKDQDRLKDYFTKTSSDMENIDYENENVLKNLKQFLKETNYE